jgi:hypothetical protein
MTMFDFGVPFLAAIAGITIKGISLSYPLGIVTASYALDIKNVRPCGAAYPRRGQDQLID